MPDIPLTKAIGLVEELRKIDPELPMQVAHVLLVIARYPGLCQREVAARTKIGKSSASRIIEGLSASGRGLVSATEDTVDRRVKLLMLTDQGHRVVRRMVSGL
ncbi:hypothetical protein ASE61_06990 [Bosea sp. Root670]|uniref:MarR family winged helix-turn-helix transcriptional regulator n=1 Tax=Bosea sp. Root670 TaxID=1736583 RepID=UPI0007142BEA|nr:MarR family winged helix-turn-helix transcriptional regulator [Bosea sp. Root670]KRE04665.1 hypothetical protein ASE61_06990 [Bosea sp. Root670]